MRKRWGCCIVSTTTAIISPGPFPSTLTSLLHDLVTSSYEHNKVKYIRNRWFKTRKRLRLNMGLSPLENCTCSHECRLDIWWIWDAKSTYSIAKNIRANTHDKVSEPSVYFIQRMLKTRKGVPCFPGSKTGLILIFTSKFTLGLFSGDVLFWYIKKWSYEVKIKRFLN